MIQPSWLAFYILAFRALKGSGAQGNGGTPRTVTAVVGESVTLPAAFSTRENILSVTWSKVNTDQSTVQQREPVFVFSNGNSKSHGAYKDRVLLSGKVSLRIANIRVQDDGMYVLNVMTEDLETGEEYVRLIVMVPPVVKVGPSSPVVSSWGKSVTFKCTISEARPNISALHWEKDGIPVQSIGVSSKYSGGTLSSPSLTVRHVTRADTGSYTCVVNHVVRPVTSSVQLKVLYPASIISISDAIAVTVSDRVTLQCVADGNPPPNITWTKNGVLLPSVAHTLSNDVRASSVTLKRVRMNNTGAYVCAASNGVGKADSKAVQLSVTPDKDARDSSNIVVIVGTVAGALWFLIGVVLILLLWKRRRDRRDKERFAFYYNMGRREPGAPDDKTDFPTIPVKPREGTLTGNAGIPTMRRAADKRGRRYARVMYPYLAQEGNELCLEVGDVIEVLEGDSGGWCLGYLSGDVGLFPSNYVKFLSSNEGRPTVCTCSRHRKKLTNENAGGPRCGVCSGARICLETEYL
ncbi:protein amalgam-like isoform X1 [Branchiostoma floridae]|uniref:Protein amalgam-like isoform X1 n=1 Tax=Branchiostoma floridae TaxID=7739 RepID=A0A9J7M913_BRAFL|nr:protein amalgam-like isoform X1 [Branchiostoma floridae]